MNLIRSKERVRDLAEVFTAPREINGMLDLVIKNSDLDVEAATFLEPSCGSGNFLAEILARKCAAIMNSSTRDGWEDSTRILRTLATINAIDIDQLNVDETHNRLFHLVLEWRELITGAPASKPFALAALSILKNKIVLGDFLVGCVIYEVNVTDEWQLILKPHFVGGGHVKNEKGQYVKKASG